MANLVITFLEDPTPAQLAYVEEVAKTYERENPNAKVTIGLPKPRGIHG